MKNEHKHFGVKDEWTDSRGKISLVDAGKAYKADNSKFSFGHRAYRVDKLLKEESGVKQCDFLLLRDKGQQNEGAAFLIECKDSSQDAEIKDSVTQLLNSYEKLNKVFAGWSEEHPRIGFRITASRTIRTLTESYFINIKKVAKRNNGSFDIRRFDLEKEIDIFDGKQEFKQRK